MDNELSLNHEINRLDLSESTEDRKSAIARAFIGLTPGFGSVLTELFNELIPNQKQERIKIFAEVLDMRVSHLETDFIAKKISTPEIALIVEEGFRQATKATTEERRKYVANLLAGAISEPVEDFRLLEISKCLSLLSELNDIEILFLKYESLPHPDAQKFKDLHPVLFDDYHPSFEAKTRAEVVDRRLFKVTCRRKLREVGLIEEEYEIEEPERGAHRFMEKTPNPTPKYNSQGKPVIKNVRVTGLGRRLLAYIESSSDKSESLSNPNG